MKTLELYQELLDARYPFKSCEHGECDRAMNIKVGIMYQSVHEPTLSELIAACGDEFMELIRQENLDLPKERQVWWKAISHKKETSDCQYEDEEYISRKAFAPEIAIAHLYLAIHNKS